MNQPTALRKGRYINIGYKNYLLITKIKDSTIVKQKQVNFDIFNIPVECIEIEDIMLHLSFNEPYFGKIEDVDKFINIIEKDNKYYVPISEISFPVDHHIKLYQKYKSKAKI